MSQPQHTPWWKLVLLWSFFAAVATSLAIGWFRTEHLPTKWIVAIFFSLCGGFLIFSLIHDWRQERRLRRLLHGRESLDPETFGARFFSDVPRGPEVATAVRQLLDEHRQRELGGLRPEDPLDHLQDWIDPFFLDELARRLGFAPPENWTEFRDLIEPQKTVRDLVNALARKLTQG